VLARQRESRKKAQLKLAAPIIARVQAQARGQMTRKVASSEKKTHRQLGTWATKLQAAARAHMTQQSWTAYVAKVKRCELPIIRVQAAARGKLARMRRANLKKDLARRRYAFEAMQAHARGRIVRRGFRENKAAVHHPSTAKMATSMQALLRGRLSRAKVAKEQKVVQAHTPTFVSLQSHLRGALVRRQQRAREKKMDDATDYIVSIQATARGVLARRRKQVFTKEAVKLTTSISSLQALARGRLAKRQHDNMQKALAKVEVAGSVGGLQAFLRTKLAKHKTVEQKKKLEFVQPDVIGFQAVARGFLARREYREWRDYLVEPYTQGALVFLQSLIRGYLCRRKFWMRHSYLYHNQDKITKVQAMWRGRTQRQMYQRLITGGGVDVPTIQHYMHLLDDTENDFRDQLRIDTLRKEVIELVRTNQTLDTEVKELDTKIALILKNKMTFEDLARAKRRRGGPHEEETFHNPNGGDPFVSVHLDRASQRKLELYEHLFFTLQTQPQYLSRLLWTLGADETLEKDCRLVEAVTLILFGFGHDRREEYLFHKLCQISMHEQILRSRSLEDLANTRFSIIPVVTQYAKPALKPFLHNVLAAHINRIIASDELDLSTDPVDVSFFVLGRKLTAALQPSDQRGRGLNWHQEPAPKRPDRRPDPPDAC
jgi:Ras GTPase-activating-like protein IQGAP2/3